MKLIHFSDTHLGFSESSRVDPQTGVNAREQDVYRAFETVVEEICRRKPDFAVHAGDLFHTPRPSNRAIVVALTGFKRLGNAGIPVFLIAGNHSVPRVSTTGSIFEALKVLPGVHAACSARYEVFEHDGAAIHCVPHVPVEEDFRREMGRVKPLAGSRFNVLVLHGAVRGFGGEFSLGEFNEVAVSKDFISSLHGFDYVALGHYHRHMAVGGAAKYSGSTERLHANEAGYEKGFVEVDLAAGTSRFVPVEVREIVRLEPIACAGMDFRRVRDAAAASLGSVPSPRGKIILLHMDEVDPGCWLEIQRARRDMERDHAPDAFEVRWSWTVAASRGRSASRAGIGSLQAEFESYMKAADVGGLDRTRLRLLGERYLSAALDAEAAE